MFKENFVLIIYFNVIKPFNINRFIPIKMTYF